MPAFTPPTRILDGPRLAKDKHDPEFPKGPLLMRHVQRPGPPVAVLVTGTTVVERQVPTAAEVNAADHAYLGGRTYTITQTEADLLTAAGYTVQED